MKVVRPSVSKSDQKTKPIPTRFYAGMVLLVIGGYLISVNIFFGLIAVFGLFLMVNLDKKSNRN